MPKPSSMAGVELDVAAGREVDLNSLTEDFSEFQTKPVREALDDEDPFKILILGDFTGRASRGVNEPAKIAARRTVLVDRDNVETLPGKMGVTIRLSSSNPEAAPIEIAIRELDDFHPDRLYQNVRVFGALRDVRERLSDRSTFAAAARELGATVNPAPVTPPPRASRPVDPASLLSGSLLDQAVEVTSSPERPESGAAPARSKDPIAALVQSIVAPHITPKPDPKQAELVRQVDDATSDLMRAILHNPAFQAAEAAWRGVFFVARGLETDEKLKISLLDLSRAELAADLANADDLKTTGLYKLLVEQTVRTPGAHPWSVLVGNYYFGSSLDDLNLLGRLGLLASQARAPFIAGARSSLVGCKSIAETPHPEDWKPDAETAEGWGIIRKMPESRYLGLILPRFILRHPYGKDFEAPETFDFEEFGKTWRHEEYLWCNGAFAAAYLLGQTFTHFGWQMKLGAILNVDGLPLHVYKQDGEAKTKPCAEAQLTETAAERMLETGLMPLLWMKDRDRVRLGGFISVADPASRIAGRWD